MSAFDSSTRNKVPSNAVLPDLYLKEEGHANPAWDIPVRTIIIQDGHCYIDIKRRLTASKTFDSPLTPQEYSDLVSVFNRYYGILGRTPHWALFPRQGFLDVGQPTSYSYQYAGKSCNDSELFESEDSILVDRAYHDYHIVIEKIIKRIEGETPMKKDLNAILSDFKAWIIDNGQAGVGSAGSYAYTYVPKLIENVLHPAFEKVIPGFQPYRSFSNSAAHAEIRRLIFAASEQIVAGEMCNANASSKKTLSNYRSGLRMFFRFMESENVYYDVSLSKQAKGILSGFVSSTTVVIEYSRDELRKTFKSRVTTWDRAYQKLLYPARLINRIFNASSSKEKYKDLLDRVIARIKFRVNPTDYVRLKNVSSIAIYPGKKVEVTTTDKRMSGLLTEDGAKNLCDMKALTVADLSIDHDVPLENLLNTAAAEKDYPYLKRLSDLYAGSKTNNYLAVAGIRGFVKRTKECYDQHKKDEFADPAFIGGLLDDLEKLYGKIECTIMDRKANSKKGKN